jgi:hypothetical protein
LMALVPAWVGASSAFFWSYCSAAMLPKRNSYD